MWKYLLCLWEVDCSYVEVSVIVLSFFFWWLLVLCMVLVAVVLVDFCMVADC